MVIRSAERGGGPYNADESVGRQDREGEVGRTVLGELKSKVITWHSGSTDKIDIETISKLFSADR